MQYSQILWATAFGVVFFDEYPGWSTAIGATIIIASGVYILLRENRGASDNRPVSAARSRIMPSTHPRIGDAIDAVEKSRSEED